MSSESRSCTMLLQVIIRCQSVVIVCRSLVAGTGNRTTDLGVAGKVGLNLIKYISSFIGEQIEFLGG